MEQLSLLPGMLLVVKFGVHLVSSSWFLQVQPNPALPPVLTFCSQPCENHYSFTPKPPASVVLSNAPNWICPTSDKFRLIHPKPSYLNFLSHWAWCFCLEDTNLKTYITSCLHYPVPVAPEVECCLANYKKRQVYENNDWLREHAHCCHNASFVIFSVLGFLSMSDHSQKYDSDVFNSTNFFSSN